MTSKPLPDQHDCTSIRRAEGVDDRAALPAPHARWQCTCGVVYGLRGGTWERLFVAPEPLRRTDDRERWDGVPRQEGPAPIYATLTVGFCRQCGHITLDDEREFCPDLFHTQQPLERIDYMPVSQHRDHMAGKDGFIAILRADLRRAEQWVRRRV